VEKKKIGPGAEIEIIRSGEVIPKLVTVLTESDEVDLPGNCPVCNNGLQWQKDFLKCDNPVCPAQIEQRIIHWFRSLGNADWFGIKTVRKIVDQGYDSLEKVYAMTETDFQAMGFGPVQSKNLYEALQISRNKPIEDWRFLSAFGIQGLGKGDSRKLLSHIPLDDLIHQSVSDISSIHGFGEITSDAIVRGVGLAKDTIAHMIELGFSLERTPLLSEAGNDPKHPLSGKGIVFTGKMQKGTREDMESLARSLGAVVQSAVSGKTDFLVCGENVGATKTEKAKKTGTRVISEEEFYGMVDGTGRM
jgi:DNA ligase (NAD+)